jgi:hypothetical protein
MTAWSEDELRRIGEAQELQIAPVRRNGELRARTTIWAVRAGQDVYVRAAIEDADRSVWDGVDAAYRAKYGHYASIVDGITNDDARATTLRLVPRS